MALVAKPSGGDAASAAAFRIRDNVTRASNVLTQLMLDVRRAVKDGGGKAAVSAALGPTDTTELVDFSKKAQAALAAVGLTAEDPLA